MRPVSLVLLKGRKEKGKGMKLNGLYYWKNLKIYTVLMLLFVSIMLPIVTEAEINSTGTYFEVSPPRNIVAANDTDITIDINIVDAPDNDTLGWGLTLDWDKTVLEVTNVQEGPFLSSVNVTSFFFTSLTAAQAAGSIDIGCSIIAEAPKDLAGGSGKLCNVTFHVISVGSSPLNLEDTALFNRAGVRKDYPNNDGFFVCTGQPVHDVYVVSVTAVPTQVQQGDEVTINVAIHNEGDEQQTVKVRVYADLITHDPEDPDKVLVGLGNSTQNMEFIIIETAPIVLPVCVEEPLPPIIWSTLNVPGEKWTISAEVIKVDGFDDDDLHDNIFIGPVVHVVSHHDLKIIDKEVLTPEVSKDVVMNFTGYGGANITAIEGCGWYQVLATAAYDGIYVIGPKPSSWWHILICGGVNEYLLYSLEFHVDFSYPNGTFHIDQVLPGPAIGINVPWAVAEMTGKVSVTVKNEGKVPENATVFVFAEDPLQVLNFSGTVLTPCEYYTVNKGFPEPDSWWHIIWPEELYCKEFHIDVVVDDTFHIDFVWPDWPEPIAAPFVLAEREIEIGKKSVENLAVNETRTLYFHWSVPGNATTGVHPGPYNIKAMVWNWPVYPYTNEEMKNWLDNKYIDGIIKVKYYDIDVASVTLLTDHPSGMHPIVIPQITLVNVGSEPTKVVCYYLADPNLAVSGDEILFGIAVLGPIPPAPNPLYMQTFTGCSPFGGWHTGITAIAPPYNVPVPCTNYTIIVKAVPSPGYRDDNMRNNVKLYPYPPPPYAPAWHLPVVSHDVAISSITVPYPRVSWRSNVTLIPNEPLEIYVNVTNQVNVAETVDVTLYNGTSTTVVGTVTGVAVPALGTVTVTFTYDLDPKTDAPYAVVLKASATIVGFTDDDPNDNNGTRPIVYAWGLLMGDSIGPFNCMVWVNDQVIVQNAMFSGILPGTTPAQQAKYWYYNTYPHFSDMDKNGMITVADQVKQQQHMFKSC